MPDIQTIISKMTLEEKAALCTGATFWSSTAIERLGVPSMIVTDGPHGVRRTPDLTSIAEESLPATCFPTASCLASSWDVDLLHKVGEALAEECIALNVNVLLGPSNNMKRTPLCGRNFEYFSEDPFLSGEMAASWINGIQSRGVGASLKHYAANNQEYQRFTINAEIDERTLREIYLPAFETAVKKSQPWTVMCCYNKVNGTYGSEHHHLLSEILKDEWGFEGLVVSDWGAVHDRVAALKGGLDWEMPGPKPWRVQAVINAVRSGELDEALLDESVRRILRIVFKAVETPKGGTFDVDAHHALARKVAAEGMVLLKNNGILPLQNTGRIAVIGRGAETPHFQGGGSSHIHPTRIAIPYQELAALAGNAELAYAQGYPADDSSQPELIDQAVALARNADIALLYIALPRFKESEGYDRPDMLLTTQQVALIKAVTAVQPKNVVILNSGAPVEMSEWIDGCAAVLQGWMMGQAGGGAVADLLFGVVNPSGKLAETFPIRLADTPAYINYPGGNSQVRYGEGLYIGYRYYDAKDVAVQFPFGHGLSYTTFAYTNPHLSSSSFKDTDGLTVSVDVTNTGQIAGKEIVQVYVHDRKSTLARPPKELKGFSKVSLAPGEKKTVTITLDFRSFAYYHPGYQQWITEDGEFDILIGASSADIRHTLTAALQSSLDLPCRLDSTSTIQEWLDDRRGRVVMEPYYQQMMAEMARTMGISDHDHEGIGMDMSGFMLDMPFVSILEFQADRLPMPPEQIVGAMLAQAHAIP
jgi:beta-glucosidase